MRPRLTILSLSTIHTDGRVLRQIEFASREYEVAVVGWGRLDRDRPHVTMFPVQRVILPPGQRMMQALRLLKGRITTTAFEHWYWSKPDHRRALKVVIETRPHIIHANEAIGLPIAIEAAARTGARVLFDAHEYAPAQRADSLSWRLFAQSLYTYIIARYARQADAMVTVEDHIAKRYETTFGIDQVEVIRNAPFYQALPFRPTDPHHIRLIHHGGAMKERRLERMIEMLALTDQRFTLDFMLVPGAPGYLQTLQRLAKQKTPHRIHFRAPVAPHAIAATINQYDIGVYLLEPRNFNQEAFLPNKFFEFIMAGLAVAIGPLPAMATIVQTHQLGIVAEDFHPATMARMLNSLTAEQIDTMKQRSLEAAKTLNAEAELRKLMAIYTRLLAA